MAIKNETTEGEKKGFPYGTIDSWGKKVKEIEEFLVTKCDWHYKISVAL